MVSTIPKTQKVILIDGISDSYEVIKYKEVPTPTVEKQNEILIKNKYSGVNFIEAYFRKGIYPTTLPHIMGMEAVGEIVKVGSEVRGVSIGDNVAYLGGSTFAPYTKVPSSTFMLKLPKNPDDSKLKLYAAAFLQTLTAQTLITEAYNVQKGDFALVYAAAGGVGSILNQLLKLRGAHSIAVASSPEKLKIAKENGAEFLINSSTDDIVERVKEITNGKGATVAFDSVGKDTFEISLEALKLKGTLVSFGNASGPVPPFPITRLSKKCLKIVRPQLYGYLTEPEDRKHYSEELVDLLDNGKINVNIYNVYPLSEYAEAAKAIESRKTTGRLLLKIPE